MTAEQPEDDYMMSADYPEPKPVTGALAPSEVGCPRGALDLATCSLPASSAEALMRSWEARLATCSERATDKAFNQRVRHLSQGYADAVRDCMFDLRRQMGVPTERQPAENTKDELHA